MNKIYIDTADNRKIIVRLTTKDKEEIVKHPLDKRKAQVVLPIIEDLLTKHKLGIKDLEEIEVNPGPGSFTGVRVGVSIANALGFALGIPVNGKKITTGLEIVEPKY